MLTQYLHSWLKTAPQHAWTEAECRILAIVQDAALQQDIASCLTSRPYREVRYVTELSDAIRLGIDGAFWDLVLVACGGAIGLDALRRLRREIGLSGTAVIAIVPGLDDLRPAIAAGADDALTLPVNPTLDLHITHALDHRGLREAVDQYWITTAQEHNLDLSRFVFDAAPDALLLLEADGIILTANPAAERLFQCEAAMLAGSPIGAFLNGLAEAPGGEPRIDHLLTRLNEPNAKPVDSVIHRLDGKTSAVEVRGRPVDRLGRPALVIALQDISHRQPSPMMAAGGNHEAVDRHAATMRLLAQLSNELLAPLDEIVSCADVIRQQALGPLGVPLYHSYAADIQQSSRALLKLVNRLMEMTKDGKSEAIPASGSD